MNATNYIVTRKCPGKAGIARITLDYHADREAYEYAVTLRDMHCGPAYACGACGRYFRFQMIQGKYSAKHECGAKCMASKGPSCECSCKGKNHGASYA